VRTIVWAAIFTLGWFGIAFGQLSYEDPKTPEGWAWAKIKNDEVADFSKRVPPGQSTPCGEFDPNEANGSGDQCRALPAKFIVDILTLPKWRDQIGQHGVRLRGARIEGSVDLSNADINPQLTISASRVHGSLNLSDSHWKHLISLQGTHVKTGIFGYRMIAEGGFFMTHATVEGAINLTGSKFGVFDMNASSVSGDISIGSAKIEGGIFFNDGTSIGGQLNLSGTTGGFLDLSSSHFQKLLSANRVIVAGNVYMNKSASFDSIDFNGSVVGGAMILDGSSFTGAVSLGSMKIDGILSMKDGAKFAEPVNLNSSSLGFLELSGARFDKPIHGSRLKIAGSVFMKNGKYNDVELTSIVVSSNFEIESSTFSGQLNLQSATVSHNLFLRNRTIFDKKVLLGGANVNGIISTISSGFYDELDMERVEAAGLYLWDTAFQGNLKLIRAKIGGAIDLAKAKAVRIDLTGADAAELGIRDLGWWCAGGKAMSGTQLARAESAGHLQLGDRQWKEAGCEGGRPPKLILRNAHVAALQDSPVSWPPVLDLEGFRYDRLGGLGGDSGYDMRKRTPAEWTDWLGRDPVFSTQPYAQLSSILLGAGRRDVAEAIQLDGRERERDQAHGLHWAWLTFLYVVAGYGIGLYTFWVLEWVAGLTFLGGVILFLSPVARGRGVVWRLGASLHRLLPVIELSKEFTDFFDNLPQQAGIGRRVHQFLQVYFAAHAMLGYVLGFFLLAAMSGLTQKG
jgi:hypothetical protein